MQNTSNTNNTNTQNEWDDLADALKDVMNEFAEAAKAAEAERKANTFIGRAKRAVKDYHIGEIVGVAAVAAAGYYGYKHSDTIMAKLGRGGSVSTEAAEAPVAE